MTTKPQDPRPQLERPADVLARVGFSKATLYRRIKAGTFPRPINLGPEGTCRSVAFIASEVDAWIAERAQAREGAAE